MGELALRRVPNLVVRLRVFELLARGDTMGVFQLESSPMRALLRAMAPDTFEDVSAVLALYRPGPMSVNMHYDYADRKNGRKAVEYFHPDAAEVLGDTYGLMIYQEQLMRVSQRLAGYSLEEADNLRKATGKKDRALIAREREKFVSGCEAQGYGTEFGNTIFDIIEPFADYSFNKSHAAAYALVAYQTAWLLASVDDAPNTVPRGEIRFYRQSAGYPASSPFEISEQAIRNGNVRPSGLKTPTGNDIFLVRGLTGARL